MQKALEVVPEKAPKGVTPVKDAAPAASLIDEIQNLVAESKHNKLPLKISGQDLHFFGQYFIETFHDAPIPVFRSTQISLSLRIVHGTFYKVRHIGIAQLEGIDQTCHQTAVTALPVILGISQGSVFFISVMYPIPCFAGHFFPQPSMASS